MQGDLSARYHGRHRREVPAPDPELTAVGPGTPCGEYLRAAWQPVCLSSQLGELPLAIRILGEDLVAFRDGAGGIGVLHRHCSHRGASLEFGRIMPRGISCCYHGWHYDLDGTILATPAEPPTSRIRETLRHGAYPAVEKHGLVFAWLGDPAAVPPPPVLDVEDEPGVTLAPFLLEIPCNWLQVYENSQDPVHVVWLHARNAGAHFDESNAADQELDFAPTPLGMMNVQTRRWGGMVWTRTVECILPNLNQTGAIWEDAAAEKAFQRVGMTRWVVPVDDTASLQIGWRHLGAHLDPNGKDRPAEIGLGRIDFEGQDASATYADRQRRPGDYDAQVSQRPVAVHALEHLAGSDRGVAMLRRMLRRAVRAEAKPVAAAGGVLATFCQDTVTGLPPAADDRALLRAHGAAVARAVLESAGLPREARRAAISAAARGTSLPNEETSA
ncbi:Rieske 2Fe-2S domain-containing protein [Falsiroseomonas sp.]|uniref:Rieske 2Fe-2S domain-containing protein n=1 Tax=Falsiroseomonas sp. TaxID=2870721 RepID=UPI0035693FFC